MKKCIFPVLILLLVLALAGPASAAGEPDETNGSGRGFFEIEELPEFGDENIAMPTSDTEIENSRVPFAMWLTQGGSESGGIPGWVILLVIVVIVAAVVILLVNHRAKTRKASAVENAVSEEPGESDPAESEASPEQPEE